MDFGLAWSGTLRTLKADSNRHDLTPFYFNRSAGNRTPIHGFGDRCSTIELQTHIAHTYMCMYARTIIIIFPVDISPRGIHVSVQALEIRELAIVRISVFEVKAETPYIPFQRMEGFPHQCGVLHHTLVVGSIRSLCRK